MAFLLATCCISASQAKPKDGAQTALFDVLGGRPDPLSCLFQVMRLLKFFRGREIYGLYALNLSYKDSGFSHSN